MERLTSKSYTVAWDERLYVTEKFVEQMHGLDYLVWDRCTEPQDRDNWVRAKDVRYFGHVYNSLVDFSRTSHGVFIFSAGDILCDNFPAFVAKVEDHMLKDQDTWLMAPHLPTDGGSGMTTAIAPSSMYPEMLLTININGLYWAMNRELALMLLEYYEWMLEEGFMDFSKMISGHCLDWVYSAMVLINNKKIYRDMSTEMFEVDGTSYDTKTALWECNNVRDRYIDWEVLQGRSENSIRSIYETMHTKTSILPNQYIELKTAYPLLTERFKY